MKIDNVRLIKLQKVEATNGHISIYENDKDVPFDVKRIFYLYDIPSGESRGAHAHKECHQFLIAITGAFEVELFDGINSKTIRIDQPDTGLHIPPGIWASEKNFSSGAICLVLASQTYDEADYIRIFEEYLQYAKES